MAAIAAQLFFYCSFCGLGGIFAKRAADSGSNLDLIISLSAYSVGTLLLLPVLRSAGLGYSVVVACCVQLVLMTAAGWALFGERISAYQICGLALAVAAVILMSVSPASPSIQLQQVVASPGEGE